MNYLSLFEPYTCRSCTTLLQKHCQFSIACLSVHFCSSPSPFPSPQHLVFYPPCLQQRHYDGSSVLSFFGGYVCGFGVRLLVQGFSCEDFDCGLRLFYSGGKTYECFHFCLTITKHHTCRYLSLRDVSSCTNTTIANMINLQ